MGIAVLFGMIASVAAFLGVVGKRRLEECVPFAICLMVVLLYACALTCGLLPGVYATLGLCGAALLYTLIAVTIRREWKAFLGRVFTPGLLVWIILFAFAWISNRGKVPHRWDEFSHWADSVKVMCQLNDLVTNPASGSWFSTYPPAMQLWQYLVQQVNRLCGGEAFSEPLLYLAYQSFMLSLYLPFLKNLSWRRPVQILISTAVVLLAGTSIFLEAYRNTYVDVFLGTLGGFVAAYGLMERKPNAASALMLSLALFVLTLTKQVGIALAAFAAVNYAVCLQPWKNGRKALACTLPAAAALALARISWSLHVAAAGAVIQGASTNPITLSGLVQALTANGWQRTTLRNFVYELFDINITSLTTSIGFSYAALLVLLAAGLAWLESLLPAQHRKPLRLTAILCYGMVFLYLTGVGVAYLFKFTEAEAVALSSFYRYVGMIVVTPFFVLCSQMLLHQYPGGIGKRATAIALGVYLAFAPWSSLLDAASGFYSEDSRIMQADFLTMEQKVRATATQDTDRIFVVAQSPDSASFDGMVFRYRLRDFDVTYMDPIVQGDSTRYNTIISPQEWQHTLVSEGYDLVIIYRPTDAFIRDYACVFEQPQLLGRLQLYRLNPETNQLALVE